MTDPATRFDDLFRRLYPQIFRLAYGLLGDRAEAEDAAQESFLRLTDAPVLSRPDEEVAAWLRRVCLNLGANRLRTQRRARERMERADRLEVDTTSDQLSPASRVLRGEEQATVRRALAQLPERQRHCLILRHSGYSYAEIAATLDVALGSVGVLLARAERAFREIYQERTDD